MTPHERAVAIRQQAAERLALVCRDGQAQRDFLEAFEQIAALLFLAQRIEEFVLACGPGVAFPWRAA